MTQTPLHASVTSAGDTPGTHEGNRHGSLRGYLVGYVVAVLLTIGAFVAAQTSALTPSSVTAAITVLAIAQMLVHLIFFLHISTSPNQRTNILAFAVALLIVAMIVAGSLWIMSHLDSNMMPMGPNGMMGNGQSMQMQP